MQETTRTFTILLLLTSFLLITASNMVDPPDDTDSLNVFTKVIKMIEQYVIHEVRGILPTLITLPASIPRNSTEVPTFINNLVHVGLEFLENNFSIDIQYYLYTPVNPHKKFVLELSQESFQKSTFNGSLETKFLIHGIREFLPETSIIYDIKDQLLMKENYNVIVVNWIGYTHGSYDKAALNSAFIGFEIAKLIIMLKIYYKFRLQSLHIIAHSLGCHVAGFIGKVVPVIGRITALDATGLLFEDLPSSLRLTDTDANFVDAIHTHGTSTYSEGSGTLLPYGDINFFPNGGSLQPGCSYGNVFLDANKDLIIVEDTWDLTDCNHQRALYLFLESINVCRFDSVMCESYQDFKDGKCPRQTSVVSSMGFHAKPIESLEPHSTFYLETSDSFPYCLDNL